ncbi:alcohol dehydrogenase catalytic domain-containing protein [Sulfurisphaera javensis]|uniref:Alcohol dehydrogenase catalytic domain-containing protein n=1 Tax=Sulfurisphaera javensis TaxID=2049879 RepID=A0AAT9GPA6_9CREN
MKALVFEKSGLENLKLSDVNQPEIGTHDVLIRVKMTGVNPIDYFVVNFIPVKPIPHIPGAEIYGEVVKVGDHVKDIKIGDRVVVYNRVFDGKCDMCLEGMEMLCRNGGIISVITNGGFSEYFSVPEHNVVKVEDISEEIAASLPVAGLTAYHALNTVQVFNKTVVVFGASGNTGQFAVQLAKMMGGYVIAVTSKNWIKDFGADEVVSYNEVEEKVKKLTDGKMADIVINSVGSSVWDKSLSVLGNNGKLLFFGGITGSNVNLDLGMIYGKHASLVGTTGGNRKELVELARIAKRLRVKTWKVMKLEEGQEALKALFDKNRDGRIFLKIE